MKTMIRLALAAIITMQAIAVSAQDNIEASLDADFVSRYIWRGQDRGGLSIQPEARVSWKGLFGQINGSTGLNKDGQEEINITLGYQLAGFNIGVTDYWRTGIDPENRYLYYDKQDGAHQFEANLGYKCKYFSLQGYCMFWGNDHKPGETKQAYSTYIELAVPFRLGNIDWNVRAGMTPMESAGSWNIQTVQTILGEREVKIPEYNYAEQAACITAALRATKDINLGDVRLPVFAELNTNPYLKKAWLVFGFSVIPF